MHADQKNLMDSVIELAFKEDLGSFSEDITTTAIVPPALQLECRIECRETCVVAGLSLASEIFQRLDGEIKVNQIHGDGERVRIPGTRIATIIGSARAIMTGERIALNFLQRMSGVATLTRRFVDMAASHGIAILDTRKTIPGLRAFQRQAVKMGGGQNHRFGLYDAILIKDNHISIAGGVAKAIHLVKTNRPECKVEVEAGSLAEVAEALLAGVDTILLDNMSPDLVRESVKIIAGRVFVEVSGGISEHSLPDFFIPGVNAISIGALTHTAPSIDFSLEVDRTL